MHNINKWINRQTIDHAAAWGRELAQTPLGKGSIVVGAMGYAMSLFDKPTYHGVPLDDRPRVRRPSFKPGLEGDPYLDAVQNMFEGRTGHHNIGNAKFL